MIKCVISDLAKLAERLETAERRLYNACGYLRAGKKGKAYQEIDVAIEDVSLGRMHLGGARWTLAESKEAREEAVALVMDRLGDMKPGDMTMARIILERQVKEELSGGKA